MIVASEFFTGFENCSVGTRHGVSPTIIFDDNDPMYVVRHNHIRAEFHIGKMIWNCPPAFMCNFAIFRQIYFLVDDFSEQTITIVGDNRDKICACGSVIISLEADPNVGGVFAGRISWLRIGHAVRSTSSPTFLPNDSIRMRFHQLSNLQTFQLSNSSRKHRD